MAREFNPTKQITRVIYDKNGTRQAAIFLGHLSNSEVERKMLFERHISRRLIIGHEHKYN